MLCTTQQLRPLLETVFDLIYLSLHNSTYLKIYIFFSQIRCEVHWCPQYFHHWKIELSFNCCKWPGLFIYIVPGSSFNSLSWPFCSPVLTVKIEPKQLQIIPKKKKKQCCKLQGLVGDGTVRVEYFRLKGTQTVHYNFRDL